MTVTTETPVTVITLSWRTLGGIAEWCSSALQLYCCSIVVYFNFNTFLWIDVDSVVFTLPIVQNCYQISLLSLLSLLSLYHFSDSLSDSDFFKKYENGKIRFASLTYRRIIVPCAVTFSTSTTTAGNVIKPIAPLAIVWTRNDEVPQLLDVSVTFIPSSLNRCALEVLISFTLCW